MRNRRRSRAEGESLGGPSATDGEFELDPAFDPTAFPGPGELGHEDENGIADEAVDWALLDTIALDVPDPPASSDTIPEVQIHSTNVGTLRFSPRSTYTPQQTDSHRLDAYLPSQETRVRNRTEDRLEQINAQARLASTTTPTTTPAVLHPTEDIWRWHASERRWVPRMLPAELYHKWTLLKAAPIGQRDTALKVCRAYERYLVDDYRTDHIYMRADPVDGIAFPHAHEALAAIMGVAGCGKSYLLDFLGEYMEFVNRQWYVEHALSPPSTATVVMGAFLGSAAANIHGSTIHSLFGMSINDTDPNASTLRTLATRHAGLHEDSPGCLVWDEIGCSPGADFVDRVDLQLRAIFNSQLPFGGLFILTLGDFAQLDAPNLHSDQWLYPLPPTNGTVPTSHMLANRTSNHPAYIDDTP